MWCNGALGRMPTKPLKYLLTTKASIDAHAGGEPSGNWVQKFVGMSPKTAKVYRRSQSHLLSCNSWCPDHMFLVATLDAKGPLLSGAPDMPRLPAQWWSRKPRQPEAMHHLRGCKATCSVSHQGCSRPKGPPRLRSLQRATWQTSCGTWRHKSSKRKSRSQADFLFACQAALYMQVHQSSKAVLVATSYDILLGQTPPCPTPFILTTRRASPAEATLCPILAASLTEPVPKQSPRPKRCHPSPDPVEKMAFGWNHFKGNLWGEPLSSKW